MNLTRSFSNPKKVSQRLEVEEWGCGGGGKQAGLVPEAQLWGGF